MKQIKIFLGGGVALLEGDDKNVGYRPSVIDPVISKLNSRKDAQRFYIVKTFTDLIHEYTPEGQQEHYHRYVENEADIAIFIFDGRIGDKTKEEVERACKSNEKRHHPTVFFYGTNLSDKDDIVTYLSSKKQYFQHFRNRNQLQHLIIEDLNQWKEITSVALFWNKGKQYLLGLLGCLLLCIVALGIYKNSGGKDVKNDIVINDSVYVSSECDISLSLMKYDDLNKVTNNAYNDSLLQLFQYKKKVNQNNELCIYPVSPILTLDDEASTVFMTPPCDSIPYHLPVFQLKMNGHRKDPIVFKRAEIEVESQVTGDSFYRFIRSDETVTIVNESMVQQPYTLDYSCLHSEESFVRFSHHENGDGISISLEIPIPDNTSFFGRWNKKYQIDGSRVCTETPTRQNVYHIETIIIEKGTRIYPITRYNWFNGKGTGIKKDFSRSLSQNEMDAESFFSVSSSSSSNIRFRIKLTDINNKVAYSNYVTLCYIKPRTGFLNPKN
ncbi:MAG: hypothetical protein MJZ20_10460 [Bacteroidaceae bacterium]|nr:hypothetical protein [Bacteroidaceae bacterium]